MKNLGRIVGPCAEFKPEHSERMSSKLSTVYQAIKLNSWISIKQ
jgi:hypothetical protein